ncbi:hypothetical protein [Helicoverpa assulta nucleopolyhedrovirus]|nr:hypothetical protein [Helicoverpa assulta nucleopolyhedrovirus]
MVAIKSSLFSSKLTKILLCTIIISISLPQVVETTESFAIDPTNLLKIISLPRTIGLYFDKIYQMRFVEDVWHFVIEVDHNIIFEELVQLHNSYNNLVEWIKNKNLTSCENSETIFHDLQTYIYRQIIELIEKNNAIDHSAVAMNPDLVQIDANRKWPVPLVTDKPTFSSRNKRNIGLNFVGSVDKFLFGVMDADDAEELHALAKNNNALNEQVKELDDELIRLVNYEDHLACIEKMKSETCDYVTNKMKLMQTQLNELKFLYINLDRAVDSAKYNRLSPTIMTPQRLYNEMRNVTGKLPDSLTWPIELNVNNMHTLIDHVVNTHVFVTPQRTLLFIIEVPLVNTENYDLYNIVPVPMCNNNRTNCAVIIPTSKYIGMSQDKRNYVRLDDTHSCKSAGANTKLCYKPETILLSNLASLCDIKIFLNEARDMDLMNDCDVRIGRFDKEIFHPIADFNRWLYMVDEVTELNFLCKNVKRSLQLDAGVGLLEGIGNKYCKVSTKRSTITLHEVKNNLLITEYVDMSSTFNFSRAIRDIDRMQFELEALGSNNDLDHDTLKSMTYRLTELRKEINNNTIFKGWQIENDNKPFVGWFSGWNLSTGWQNFLSSLTIIVSVIVVVLVTVVVLRCFCSVSCCMDLCDRLSRRRPARTVVRNDRQLVYLKANHRSKDSFDQYDEHKL